MNKLGFAKDKLGFIDIETIPPGELEEFELTKSPPKTIKKEEKIQEWIEENREKQFRDQAKNPKLAEVICLCFSLEDKDNFDIDSPNMIAFYGDNEKDVLISFENYLKENLIEFFEEGDDVREIQSDLEWVGYNIRKYDLEVLWLKAIKYELYFLAKLISRKRFDNSVFDLMEQLQGPNTMDFISYDKAMKLLGLGSKTEGMDGSKVYDSYLAGELESKIVPYCVDDVLGNRKIYAKMIKGI